MGTEELVVKRKNSYMGEGLTFSGGNQSQLVLKQPGIEVAFDFMPKGSAGVFYIPGGDTMTEINYILKGKIELRDKNEIILVEDGDFFYQKGTERYISFEVHRDTQMFYINNQPYFDEYEQQISGLMKVLNQLQEADGDTLDHCERVKALCLGTAHYIGFDQTKLNILFYASRFHDVGKSKIPLEILLKPGRLTEEEFEVMKLHSQYTYEMIREYYGEEIASAAYEHHERLDGTGYPRHLKGDAIGLPARIICVADAYDAMIHTRPYHNGKKREEAFAELWRCAGTQFDEKVIRALSAFLDSRERIALGGE